VLQACQCDRAERGWGGSHKRAPRLSCHQQPWACVLSTKTNGRRGRPVMHRMRGRRGTAVTADPGACAMVRSARSGGSHLPAHATARRRAGRATQWGARNEPCPSSMPHPNPPHALLLWSAVRWCGRPQAHRWQHLGPRVHHPPELPQGAGEPAHLVRECAPKLTPALPRHHTAAFRRSVGRAAESTAVRIACMAPPCHANKKPRRV
jgi:hypothetical protein